MPRTSATITAFSRRRVDVDGCLSQQVWQVVEQLERIGPSDLREELEDLDEHLAMARVFEDAAVVCDVALHDLNDSRGAEALELVALLGAPPEEDRVDRGEDRGRVAGDQELVQLEQMVQCGRLAGLLQQPEEMSA